MFSNSGLNWYVKNQVKTGLFVHLHAVPLVAWQEKMYCGLFSSPGREKKEAYSSTIMDHSKCVLDRKSDHHHGQKKGKVWNLAKDWASFPASLRTVVYQYEKPVDILFRDIILKPEYIHTFIHTFWVRDEGLDELHTEKKIVCYEKTSDDFAQLSKLMNILYFCTFCAIHDRDLARLEMLRLNQ